MKQDSIVGRIGSTLALGFGYLCLHGLVLGLLWAVLAPLAAQGPDQSAPTLVFSNGQPLFRVPWQLNQSWEFATLDGQQVESIPGRKHLLGATLGLPGDAWGALQFQPPPDWKITQFVLGRNLSMMWYFVQERVGDQFTGYFAGYSNVTRRPSIYVGRQGESEVPPPPAERFQLVSGSVDVLTDAGWPLNYQSFPSMLESGSGTGSNVIGSLKLLTQRGVEHVDLNQRQVRVMFPNAELFTWASLHTYEVNDGSLSQSATSEATPILLRSAATVYLLQKERVQQQYTIPIELRERIFRIIPVDRDVVYYVTSLTGPIATSGIEADLVKCDATGKILETRSLPTHIEARSTQRRRDATMMAIICPVPIQLLATLRMTGMNGVFWAQNWLSEAWPSIVCLMAIGIGCIVVLIRVTQRSGAARLPWGWMVFVGVFGLPGLMGYLAQPRNRRPLVPPPEPRLGTEIFD